MTCQGRTGHLMCNAIAFTKILVDFSSSLVPAAVGGIWIN